MFVNLENLTAGMTFLVSQNPEVLESFEILRTVKEYLSTQAADAQLVQAMLTGTGPTPLQMVSGHF